MAYDGHLKFDTSVDGKGFQQGISTLAKGAAAALTAVSAALGAMAGYAVKVGSDFEAGMSEVAAISGATGRRTGCPDRKGQGDGREHQIQRHRIS